MKRKRLLEKAIAEGEDTEQNRIRREICAARYGQGDGSDKSAPADGYFGLWMSLEYHKEAGRGFLGFGAKRAVKEIQKRMRDLRIQEFLDRGGDYAALEHRELCHMVRGYLNLCKIDKSYSSGILGLVRIKEEDLENKMRSDLRTIAYQVPAALGMEKELEPVILAIREVYEEFFPFEGGL